VLAKVGTSSIGLNRFSLDSQGKGRKHAALAIVPPSVLTPEVLTPAPDYLW